MIEQLSNTIRFHGFFIASAVGATGLTVTIDVRKNGTLVVTGGAATEEGGGLYYYDLASGSVDAEGYYTAVFKTTGTADQKHVPSLVWIQKAGVEWNIDQLAQATPGSYASGTAGHSIGRIGSASITVTSAVTQDGGVSIVKGDDYNATDGTALDFSSASWPTLTSATITATFRTMADVVALTLTGSVVTPTGTKVVRLQPTAAQTDTLTVGKLKHDIEATLTSGRKVTLVRGITTVLEAQTRS